MNKMNKLFRVALAGVMCLALTACGSKGNEAVTETPSDSEVVETVSGSDTLKGTYSINITGEDYGCSIDKAIVTFDYVVDEVTKDTFKVEETKKTTDWTDPEFAEKEATFPREVTAAYLCDENGERTTEPSKYVAIEMAIDPNTGSPLTYSPVTGFNTWCDPYYLNISLADGAALKSAGTEVTAFEVDVNYTSKTTDADNWKKETKKYDEFDYNIATYVPEGGSDILFVWLHGAGEGGSAHVGDATNVDITLLANKVTALAGEDFQTTLGGCSVLAPQCPTYWMDNGSGVIAGERTSIYTESLVKLIDDYAEELGAEKIAIGGCSNGGYMTMVLAMECGDKYQAYVPICEAMADAHITDEDINVLKDLPMYFVYSEDDTIVDPTAYEIPTIERLTKAGAADLHVSTTEHVVDTSGQYKDADGNPYMYQGHWSWIYFDNDETADADGVTAFDWLAGVLR